MTPAATFRFTTQELASKLGATLRGPATIVLERLDTLESADASALTFIRDARNAARWPSASAGAALLSRSLASDAASNPPDVPGRALLVVEDADRALITLLEELSPPPEPAAPGIHAHSSVHPSARIAPDASIGPCCSIAEDVEIGAGCVLRAGVTLGPGVRVGAKCVLHPGVVVYPRCSIGARCALHAGCVIGCDGFGYRPSPDKRGVIKVPHIGTVKIHDDVEIGAGTTIDRAKFGATVIGAGTKIDNLVQIGHNVVIGRSCIICGCAAIAGSATLGDGVTLAGGVGIADNITIGSGASIGARSGVMNDIPAGESWVGYPARPVRQTFRIVAATEQLPDLISKVKKMMRDP